MQASGNFHCDEHNRTAEPKTERHNTTMTIGGAGYQITRQVQDLPEDEQGQAALDLVELEKAKKEIREKDAEIDRQSKACSARLMKRPFC